ncbi:MAG: hypothetical protein E7295_03110 [Lachnospiraceae bacterium]|nr:hypothetical protein [Lachnospiraceae bacterium]
MPPSRHSHSSHSSHRSSHSSHSRSSHSARSSYSSSRSSSSYRSRSNSSYSYTPKFKTRSNQPRGWNASLYGQSIIYACKDHDYVYYPHSWTSDDGIDYQAGYYDEKGIYYSNVVAKDMETILTCKYCGSKMTCKWTDGMETNCPNCGSAFEIDKIDVKQNEVVRRTRRLPFFDSLISALIGIFVLVCSLPILAGIATAVMNNVSSSASRIISSTPSSVYVSEIGRTCKLDGEDYYDATTQCWFWWDDELDPPQWQYWYEGISSKYGDYGWMEYDAGEQCWYIEVNDGDWRKLMVTEEAESRLWHFKNAYTNELY